MVTVITKTIGPSGRDYATFTLAEADVTNIGTSADLVANDEAIVFEADAGTYTTGSTLNIGASTLVTDATRNVTYTKAAGPVAYVFTGGGSAINIFDAYTVWRGIDITYSGSEGLRVVAQSGYPAGVPGVTIQNVTVAPAVSGGVSFGIEKLNTSYPCGTAAEPIRILNCVSRGPVSVSGYFPSTGHTTGAHMLVVNCTHLGDGVGAVTAWNWYFPSGAPDASFKIINCANLANTASNDANILGGGVDVSGSGYNVGNSAATTSSFRFENIAGGIGSQYTPTTDLDPGPGDWAIYDATNGALIDDPDNDVLAGGIGPDANPDVPTTDIVGNTRSGATTDPGAFEISTLTPPAPALITIMRQIYQQDASFSIGASSAGVEKITHQLGPASADYFTINSTTSATVSVPRTAHALRVICVVASKACDVTLDLDASNSVYLGSIGGVASVQTDLTYFWSFGQVVSDGTYPRVRIADDGFSGDQLVYLWWHLA